MYLLAASGLLATGLVAWCWTRWLRVGRLAERSPFRNAMTVLSLFALSTSCVIFVLVLIVPEVVGIRGYEPHFGPFVLGCGAAVLGGLLAASAIDVVRDLLGLSAGILIFEWLVLLNG